MGAREQVDIRGLFRSGDLTIHKHTPYKAGGNYSAFVGKDIAGVYSELQKVSILSRFRGGEIRGYMLVNNRLHVVLPSYVGPWPELDIIVAELLGHEVVSPAYASATPDNTGAVDVIKAVAQ